MPQWGKQRRSRILAAPLAPAGQGSVAQRTPSQAADPCAWACRRLLLLPLQPKRNAAPMPPARGAWARLHGAEGAGSQHCRLGLRARVAPCSCGARNRHASVENTGLPLVLSPLCCFAHFFSARTCNRTAAASPFPLLRGRNRRAAGGNDAALPCGQGGAVGVRGTTLFALWAKALQSGAPDFGLSRGKVG